MIAALFETKIFQKFEIVWDFKYRRIFKFFFLICINKKADIINDTKKKIINLWISLQFFTLFSIFPSGDITAILRASGNIPNCARTTFIIHD